MLCLINLNIYHFCKYSIFSKNIWKIFEKKIILLDPAVWRRSKYYEPWVCKKKKCLQYILSAVMSENYIVFIEQPIKLDLLKFMLYRIQGKSFHKCMKWEPQCDTIFHVVNRHTGEVRLPPLLENDSLTMTLNTWYCSISHYSFYLF